MTCECNPCTCAPACQCTTEPADAASETTPATCQCGPSCACGPSCGCAD